MHEPVPIMMKMRSGYTVATLPTALCIELCHELAVLGAGAPSPDRGFRVRGPSAFERFLQLAGDLADRRLHLAFEDLGGTGKRLVECWFDGGLADHDEPGRWPGTTGPGLLRR